MSLAAPGLRASLLRPVSDSLDLYDNLATPETTYSSRDFRDLPRFKSMQAENASLGVPMMDPHHFNITDDDMVDSDTEFRRDEDVEIEDIDGIEVYSAAGGGDFDGNYVMEDDMEYGAPGEHDNDDVMLDDVDPEDTTPDQELQDVDLFSNPIEEIADPRPSDIPSTSEPGAPYAHNTSFPEQTDSQSPLKPQQSPSPRQEADGTATDETAPQPPLLVDSSKSDAPDDVPNDHKSAEPSADVPIGRNASERAWSEDNTSATLSTGPPAEEETPVVNPEDNATAPAEHAESKDTQNTEQAEVSEPQLDSPYTHPVIVSYESVAVSLFPPPNLSAEETARSPFRDVPTDFFIEDTAICDRGLDSMFVQLRQVLVDDIGDEDELVIEIEPLGLTIGEDNVECSSLTFRTLLDLHVRLHRQEGVETPPPVNMLLIKQQRFWKRVQLLTLAADEGKGISESLRRYGGYSMEFLEGADSVADEHEVVEETDETNIDASNAEPADKSHEDETDGNLQRDAEKEEGEEGQEKSEAISNEQQANIEQAYQSEEHDDDGGVEAANVDLEDKANDSLREDVADAALTPIQEPEVRGEESEHEAQHVSDHHDGGKSEIVGEADKNTQSEDEEEELLEYEDDDPAHDTLQQLSPSNASPEDHHHGEATDDTDGERYNLLSIQNSDPSDPYDWFFSTDQISNPSLRVQNIKIDVDQLAYIFEGQQDHIDNHEDQVQSPSPEPDQPETPEHKSPAESFEPSSIPVLGGDDESEVHTPTAVTQEHYDEYGYGEQHEGYRQPDQGDQYAQQEIEFQQDVTEYYPAESGDGNFEYPQDTVELEGFPEAEVAEELDDLSTGADQYTGGYEEGEGYQETGEDIVNVPVGYTEYHEDGDHTAVPTHIPEAQSASPASAHVPARQDSIVSTQSIYADDEELIEYVDDDDVAQEDPAPVALSPSQKRFRGSPEGDDDGEVDEVQAAKRVRSD